MQRSAEIFLGELQSEFATRSSRHMISDATVARHRQGRRRFESLMAEYHACHRRATRNESMWKCYEVYAKEEGVEPLPTSEARMLGYIG